MLSGEIIDNTGKKHRLHDLFFDPKLIEKNGIDHFLGGLCKQHMQRVDNFIVESVRSFLFGSPLTEENAKGNKQIKTRLLDLAALNIQRGRDHGLPSYNTCREEMGLKVNSRWSDITSDIDVQRRLEQVYKDVSNIDPWVGGLL